MTPVKSQSPSLVQAHHANIDVALLENTILSEQHIQVVAHLEEGVAKTPNIVR
jgi:hypothetical protein